LTRHTGSDDLGLRLAGEQLAAGVRFVRLVREGAYDLVVGNAPYQDTTKIERISYLMDEYPLGKRNLYSAFLVRGLELACAGGFSALLTIRDWMFLDRFKELRKYLLETFALRSLHDMASGAFEEIPTAQVVVTVASGIFQRTPPDGNAYALRVFHPRTVTSVGETVRKRAATVCHASTYTFKASSLVAVPDWPLVYWWPSSLLSLYQRFPTLGSVSPAIAFQSTGNNERFIRLGHECQHIAALLEKARLPNVDWAPCINGAEGREWIEPLNSLIAWQHDGLALRVNKQASGQGNGALARESFFFRHGVCFTMIGSRFAARAHRYPSVCGDKGNSLYPANVESVVCAINSELARGIVQDLNPSLSFQSGDVNRLPSFSPTASTEIFARVEPAFAVHESHREPSVEYRQPGPSPWRHAQEWAQLAVDRPEGDPPPTYVEELDSEPATDHLSYALGVSLGRFGPHGEGILDLATADLSHALPGGILFLDRTLDGNGTSDRHDSLFSAACRPLHDAWATYGERIETRRRTLRDWLALDFFGDAHKKMYENRPIHWPLSSESKTFIAWVNIHRFTDRTLRLLLADHLVPRLTQIEGELADLRTARDGVDKKAAKEADDRVGRLIKARDELAAFIKDVETCDDKGPPPTDATCPAREQDARYTPDLDDGVMINSAALWPLLNPQWRDPKKWWKELAKAQDRKDYDWSHLAMRYWPTRVDAKCQEDPSLAVAHGCFWRYHPARAWAWELRLQAEIGPDLRITEAPYTPGGRDMSDAGDGPHRDAWLRGHAEEALAAVEKEAERRQGRARRRVTVSDMKIIEPGLWSTMPAEVWRMEIRLSERQGAEFRLVSPDEPEQRAAYVKANPELARARASALAQLKPVAEMFTDDEEDEDEDALDGDDGDDGDTSDEEDDRDG
jgi:hypothetical protein